MIEQRSVENIQRTSVRNIVHPTDRADVGAEAFAHALRVALAAKADLYPIHVTGPHDSADARPFPKAERMLAQWGLIDENEMATTVEVKLGMRVINITLDADTPQDGILHFLDKTPSNLVVLATHGRDGLDHWLYGSIAESVFRRSRVPTLFVRAGSRGFVRQVSGDITLRRVLVPVDHWPTPSAAINSVRGLCRLLTGHDVVIDLLHVGSRAPAIQDTAPTGGSLPVIIRYGNVVGSILDAAFEFDVDLIAMPTAGHHGVLDALRGSTTERVLRHAPCPVYAVPVT